MTQQTKDKWDIIIRPKNQWLDVPLQELWKYRDLVLMFVKRDFVAQYKQTILGPLWYIIQPLFSTIIFTIVFGKIANIPTDGLPPFLFYLSGLVCWNYFAECLTVTSNTFIANSGIFSKVYFPRLAVPISVAISSLIKFSIQFLLFSGFCLYFYFQGVSIKTSASILYLPLLILQMGLLGLGLGIIVSALTTRYRDLTLLVGFGVQLWMYATPIVYPISKIPERFRYLFELNPMAEIITNFRYIILGVGEINLTNTAISAGISIVTVIVGAIIFSRVEKTFMDSV